jgi:hypothetical protein
MFGPCIFAGKMELGNEQNEQKSEVGLSVVVPAHVKPIDFEFKLHQRVEKCPIYSAI